VDMQDKVISFIKSRIPNLAENWSKEILHLDFMDHYKNLSEEELKKRNNAVYKNLIEWFESGASNATAEQYFEGLGAKRFKEGFALTEINYAFFLDKKVLFKEINDDIGFTKELGSAEAVNLICTLGNFFDLGNFYIIRGYNSAMIEKLENSNKFSSGELDNLMFKGSLDEDDLDNDDIIWRHVY